MLCTFRETGKNTKAVGVALEHTFIHAIMADVSTEPFKAESSYLMRDLWKNI